MTFMTQGNVIFEPPLFRSYIAHAGSNRNLKNLADLCAKALPGSEQWMKMKEWKWLINVYRQHCSESGKVSCAGALDGAKKWTKN